LTDPEESEKPTAEGEVLGAPEYRLAGEIQQVEYRSSPYPAPAELRQYEEILPGFTERILSLTERESEHRIQEERLQTRATITLAERGQKYAFIIVLALVAVGGAGIATGHSVAGLAGVIAAAATVVTAFVAPRLFDRLRRRGAKPGQGQLPSPDEPNEAP
jgi:uncharacterized membrane protein